MSRALVLLSGGKDSAVALWWARERFHTVRALSIGYPERPAGERAAATRLAALAGCQLTAVDLPFMRSTRTLLTERAGDTDTAGAYVPMRNLLVFAVAGYHAELLHADTVVAGQLASDGAAYSDATEEFFEQLTAIFRVSLSGSFLPGSRELNVALPLSTLSDVEAMTLGRRLGVPFDLTWSCLLDGPTPCQSCVSCRDRERALAA